MATISSRRLGFVILAAVLLTSLFTWRLQASGLMAAMFDSSSSPISPIITPTPTATATPVALPTETPVPPPIVISIAPDHGSDTTTTHVTIRGAYFQKPPTVTIDAHPLTDIHWVNHTKITGKVPAGLAPGAYTLHVCNPDAQCGRLENAFTVTGERPILTAIIPAGGRNDVANEVAVFGHNLRPGITIAVGSTDLTGVTWISEGEARGVVPSGLPAGVYDVKARNPGVPDMGVLPDGYTVLDGAADDFFVTEADLWTDPATLRQGETSAVLLGANIHRQGGSVAKIVQVNFFRGDPAAGGVLLGTACTVPLGTASTVPMPPVIGAVEPVFITWNPGDLVGAVSIYVQVDPADLILETNETNNLARRDLVILPPARDVTPPVIVSFNANEGSQSTTDPAVRLALRATDDLSGVYSMYLAERVFNATANLWLVVQQTGWIPFQGASEFTLTGPGGARYLEAWVADGAGNVTPLSTRARINYLPPSDIVLHGQVRLFRFTAAAGERLAATLTTLNADGDADLYVWGPARPEGRELWISNQAGATVDAVSFVAPQAGEYDIEVHGWNPRSEYRLDVAVGGTAAGHQPTAAGTSAAGKPTPTRPADASAAAPTTRGAIPAAPVAPPAQVHLPLVMRNDQPPPRPTYRIHLPMVFRNYTPAPSYKIRLPIVMR